MEGALRADLPQGPVSFYRRILRAARAWRLAAARFPALGVSALPFSLKYVDAGHTFRLTLPNQQIDPIMLPLELLFGLLAKSYSLQHMVLLSGSFCLMAVELAQLLRSIPRFSS